MKILLTGHTSSVGQVLMQHFRDHLVTGISRSTGYDLEKAKDRESIIQLAETYDHFINLANVGIAQSELLYGVYRSWQQLGKTGKIISFGTMATRVPFSLLKRIPIDTAMLGNKLTLEKIHHELSTETPFGEQPQSVLIRFANYGAKEGQRSNEPFTSPEQMTEILDFVLNSKTYISTIDFREI